MSFEETLKQALREVLNERDSGPADDKLLTSEQVAELLGYNDIHSVYQLRREGRLTGLYLSPKALRFRNSEVQRLIKDLAA